jgi:hypothetical protein
MPDAAVAPPLRGRYFWSILGAVGVAAGLLSFFDHAVNRSWLRTVEARKEGRMTGRWKFTELGISVMLPGNWQYSSGQPSSGQRIEGQSFNAIQVLRSDPQSSLLLAVSTPSDRLPVDFEGLHAIIVAATAGKLVYAESGGQPWQPDCSLANRKTPAVVCQGKVRWYEDDGGVAACVANLGDRIGFGFLKRPDLVDDAIAGEVCDIVSSIR